MKRSLLGAVASLALAACATAPATYQASSGPHAAGYSEYRIEPGRYRVTYRGTAGASLQQVQDMALRRAADLALAEGYDWYRVTDRNVLQERASNGPRVSLGVGGGNFGWRGGVGVGVGTSFNLGGGPAVESTIEVLMGKGPKPADGDVYDAHGVRRVMGQPV